MSHVGAGRAGRGVNGMIEQCRLYPALRLAFC
jgi:hypothetical protein